ncbi:MAG: alpha/beta hydrolase [Rhodospirillales bacterium]
MTFFFNNFDLKTIDAKRGPVRLRTYGKGPALLLLHGNPQTHAMWHLVAPKLSESYTVVCPDLCGYGQSFKPAASNDHAAYAKKQMAADMVDVMERLGHKKFYVAAHDRGARVAHRLALDFSDQVKKLALLDIIPTIEHFERTDMNFAMGYYHWFWFAQPHPLPESIINKATEDWFHAHTSREPKDNDFFHPDALYDYLRAAKNPEMITGMCEDYRAAATIDMAHDRASRDAGDKINCPLLILWGSKGKIGQWYDPINIWSQYSQSSVQGSTVNSGHYLAEEAPSEVITQLEAFFA